MTESHPNVRGEVFRIGDIVAAEPDVPHAVKDRGEIIDVGTEYGPRHVIVRWQGPTGDCAHIDRIALVAPGIFS